MRIGRLFGIDVIIDASWLLIAALMTFNLTAVFGQWHPRWGVVESFVVAVIATVLFFMSILAHEFAHALVAMSLGLTVTNIRLFLFGGVSNIDRQPPSAAGEFAMAIVGPVLSIGLGMTLVIASSLFLPHIDPISPMHTIQQLGPIATLVVWLGPLNIVVGAFNMLPGYPLDGGRVARAVVWGITKDLDRATRFASILGQILGWTFVGIGVFRFFVMRQAIDALWISFIGWFLAAEARRSYESMRIQSALEGIRVDQLMRRPGPLVSPDATVRELVEEDLVREGVHAVAVWSNGALVGLVSVTDVGKIDRAAWDTTTVGAIMTNARDLVVVEPQDMLIEAFRKLGDRPIEQLPVLSRGAVVGMLDLRLVTAWLKLVLGNTRTPTLRHAGT